MNARVIAASLAAVFLAIGTAQASGSKGDHEGEDRGARLERFFEQMDVDKDGRLTRDEVRRERMELFGKADQDGDGALGAAEYQRYRELQREARAARRFARLDANGDGALDAEELNARREARFERMDSDGDGALSPEEVRESMKKWHKERRGDR